MNRNALIVLEALMMGIPVVMDGYEMTLINNILCIPMYDEQGEQIDRMFGLAMPLQRFLDNCENMNEDQVIAIAMNVGLNKERQR